MIMFCFSGIQHGVRQHKLYCLKIEHTCRSLLLSVSLSLIPFRPVMDAGATVSTIGAIIWFFDIYIFIAERRAYKVDARLTTKIRIFSSNESMHSAQTLTHTHSHGEYAQRDVCPLCIVIKAILNRNVVTTLNSMSKLQ